MTKDELRIQAKLHLGQLQISDTDAEIAAEHFRASVEIPPGAIVSGYWPLGREFDPRPAMDDAQKAGARLALPVASRETRVMRFAAWDGQSPLVKGDFGIYVPKDVEEVEPDIVIVPMLAFDRKGNRLGKGAGHYDATLAHLRTRKNVLVVGMAHAGQAVLFSLPAEPHDEKLDLLITPQGVTNFRI